MAAAGADESSPQRFDEMLELARRFAATKTERRTTQQ